MYPVPPAPAGSRPLFPQGIQAQLPGPNQNSVLQLYRRIARDFGTQPLLWPVPGLFENRDFDAVGPQATVQNVNRQFEPFILAIGCAVPISYDHTAERLALIHI